MWSTNNITTPPAGFTGTSHWRNQIGCTRNCTPTASGCSTPDSPSGEDGCKFLRPPTVAYGYCMIKRGLLYSLPPFSTASPFTPAPRLRLQTGVSLSKCGGVECSAPSVCVDHVQQGSCLLAIILSTIVTILISCIFCFFWCGPQGPF